MCCGCCDGNCQSRACIGMCCGCCHGNCRGRARIGIRCTCLQVHVTEAAMVGACCDVHGGCSDGASDGCGSYRVPFASAIISCHLLFTCSIGCRPSTCNHTHKQQLCAPPPSGLLRRAQPFGAPAAMQMSVLTRIGLPESTLRTCFTTSADGGPVRVVPWGYLGDTWPFFRPNFQNMELARAATGADQVVGFCSTGWLQGANKTRAAGQEPVCNVKGGVSCVGVELRVASTQRRRCCVLQTRAAGPPPPPPPEHVPSWASLQECGLCGSDAGFLHRGLAPHAFQAGPARAHARPACANARCLPQPVARVRGSTH
eukprot:361636-Chlamydomonas_euryale.AAC.2